MSQTAHAPELVLYMLPTCPYCARVVEALDELRQTHPLKVKLIDIGKDAQAKERLIRVGGKATVPCLFIDGKPLYESADIVAYIRGRAD